MYFLTCILPNILISLGACALLSLGGIVGYWIRENQIKRSDNRKLAKKIKKFIHKYEKL